MFFCLKSEDFAFEWISMKISNIQIFTYLISMVFNEIHSVRNPPFSSKENLPKTIFCVSVYLSYFYAINLDYAEPYIKFLSRIIVKY